jgi:hypothetical protein
VVQQLAGFILVGANNISLGRSYTVPFAEHSRPYSLSGSDIVSCGAERAFAQSGSRVQPSPRSVHANHQHRQHLAYLPMEGNLSADKT